MEIRFESLPNTVKKKLSFLEDEVISDGMCQAIEHSNGMTEYSRKGKKKDGTAVFRCCSHPSTTVYIIKEPI